MHRLPTRFDIRRFRWCAAPGLSRTKRELIRMPVAGSALHLDVDEHEFEPVGVDDVVLDAGLAEIRLAGDQLGLARAARLFEPQRAAGDRHDAVIVFVPVPAGGATRWKPPLGDAQPGIVDLHGRDGTRALAHRPVSFVAASAASSTAFSSTLAPAVRSSGLASSISLWLMPPTQGTKIIAVGATRAM